MNETNFKTWLDRLAVGDLAQVQGSLVMEMEFVGGERRFGYCCLGVGCLVAEVQEHVAGSAGQGLVHKFGATECTGLAPIEFVDWLGLNVPENGHGTLHGEGFDLRLDLDHHDRATIDWAGAHPFANDEDEREGLRQPSGSLLYVTATQMNDEFGLTFPQIADMFRHFGVAVG